MITTRRLGMLAVRTVAKRTVSTQSLHTSALLLRAGSRRASPSRNRLSGPPGKQKKGPSFSPPKLAPPLPQRTEKLTPAQVHTKLIHEVDHWATISAFANVTALGIPKYIARDWLKLFPQTVHDELNAIDPNVEQPPDSPWNLSAIADDMHDDPHLGMTRAFMIRFLNFAISQLSSSQSEGGAFRNLLTSLCAVRDATDLRHMIEWYPLARTMRRKVIMHVGPTNSGKTYNALQALAGAPSGVYAGPLRLLAHEVWQRINKGSIAPKQPDTAEEQVQPSEGEAIIDLDDAAPVSVTTEVSPDAPPISNPIPAKSPPPTGYAGRPCNLLTGEEQRIVSPNATAVSCTVEMIPKHLIWDVGVIDEIQMLADPHRGGAWTSAVLGLAARELHLCGEDTVVDLVRALCAMTGDELIVNRYERLTPLEVAPQSLRGKLRKVERGDCVVTFSRTEIFLTKRKIERVTGLRCAVVYGRLPPEVRSEQAQLFNSEDSGYDVIVASDSVGMGLNLKIRRVVFMRTDKWNGKDDVSLSIPLIKQIAGRAGRFGLLKSKNKDSSTPKSVADIAASQPPGIVTAFQPTALERIREALSTPNPKVEHARVDIANPNIELLAQALPPGTGVSDLLETMRLLARLPAHTKLGVPNIEQREKVASPQHVFNFDSTRPDDVSLEVDLITRYLPINERLVFASSPVRWRDPLARKAALAFINAYESQMHVNIRRELEGMGLVESLDKVRKLKRDWDRQRKYVNTKKLSEDHNGVIIDDKDLIRLDQTTLQMLESLHATLVLYMWLSYRLPLGFYQASQAQIMKNEVEKGIEWCLERIRSKKIKNADSSFEEEVEEKPTEHHIEYLTRGEVERWRREGMTSAAWGDLLENARRATG